MRELDKALEDIGAIRSQIAASTTFRGLGPGTLMATGVVALATAGAQAVLLADPTGHPAQYFVGWVAAAGLSSVVVALEMLTRSRRQRSRLENAVIYTAIEQFLPSAVAGVFLGAFAAIFAPEANWLLPGLWQVLTGLGIFAAARSLPGPIRLVGAWYVLAGFAVLIVSSETQSLSPWAMGLPFAIGQTLAAAIFHFSAGGADERA